MKFDFTKSKIIRLSLFIAVLTIVAYAGNVYVKEGVVRDVDGQIKFGSWVTTGVLDTTYQASTDGFVVFYTNLPVNTNLLDYFGYTDSYNPPRTIRTRSIALAMSGVDYPQIASFTMPVRKGDYWKVNITHTYGTVHPTVEKIQWIPARA